MISSGHSASWSGSSIWQYSTCWQNTLLGRENTLLPLYYSQIKCLSYSSESLRNYFFFPLYFCSCSLPLAIHFQEIDTFPFADESWPHEELCVTITVWNPLSEVIWPRLHNVSNAMALPTGRIEGDTAGKKPSALQMWWWCLWKSCHPVQFFPLSQGKFPKHSIVWPALVFQTNVNVLEHRIFL